MSSSDDVIDIRIRFTRGANPILFKAIEGFENRAGVRTRNDFLKQLAEMGLVVHEERMRRDHQVGLSTRISGGLVDSVASSIATTPTSAPAATAPQPLARAAADQTVEHSVIAPLAPRAEQAAAPAVEPSDTPSAELVPSHFGAADDDRPPPRIAGQRARRLLAGDTGE
ncbi:MAG: hypothetical protein JSS14_22450 [Proteobacteria bacterium]|nr:hypothetical protein [Pseudomonadota bacterium]